MTKFKWTHCTKCGCELNELTRFVKYKNKGKSNEIIISSQLCKIHKVQMVKDIRNKSYHNNKPQIRIKTKAELKVKEISPKKVKESKEKKVSSVFTKELSIEASGRLTGRAAVKRVFENQRLARLERLEKPKKIKTKLNSISTDNFNYNFNGWNYL